MHKTHSCGGKNLTVSEEFFGVFSFYISEKYNNYFAKSKTENESETAVGEVRLAKGSAGELKLENVSDRDAAMIMAIVADQMGVPLNTLRFKSIKDITDQESDK